MSTMLTAARQSVDSKGHLARLQALHRGTVALHDLQIEKRPHEITGSCDDVTAAKEGRNVVFTS